MSLAPDVAHHRAKHAALTRSCEPDDPRLLNARRDLAAATLADRIRSTIDAAPPLTDEQRERLAALLRPSVKDGGQVA